MKRIFIITMIAALAASLAGCPKKPTTVPPRGPAGQTVPQSQGSTAGTAGAAGTEMGQPKSLPGADAAGQSGATNAAENTIYFDFDSSEIKPQYSAIVATQARRLGADHNLHVRLEGHTDERGSAEYNIGLGERRAQSVKRALLLQGVVASQLATVSFGAERPVADGHDESAWAQNRRVVFDFAGAR